MGARTSSSRARVVAAMVAVLASACASGPAEPVPAGPPGAGEAAVHPSTAACDGACAVPLDACAGAAPLALLADGRGHLVGGIDATTEGAEAKRTESCGGGSSPERVFRIEPGVTGRGVARLEATYPAVLAARSACAADDAELACAIRDALDGAGPEVAFDVHAGQPVFLVVDGYAGTAGSFGLRLDVAPATCGDGRADSPEACDDGNVAGGDGCSAACTLESPAILCASSAYRIDAELGTPGRVSFAGDTSTRPNAVAPIACTAGAGPDATYAITAARSGTLSLALDAAYAGAVLHVKRSCQDVTTQVACEASSVASEPVTTDVPVTAGETVFVSVDGIEPTSRGLYRLDATLTAAACGNGLRDPDEECDDANVESEDGCSSACLVERDAASYTCPGAAIVLGGEALTRKVHGTTAPDPGSSVPSSKWALCGLGGPDVVYAVTSDVDGMLTAKVRGTFDAALAIRAACASGTDLVCARANAGLGAEVAAAPIAKGTPRYVVVDGASAKDEGAFELELSVIPAVCGNGVAEGGEDCDDGAKDDGDGCSSTCALETEKARDVCGAGAPLVSLVPDAGGVPRARIVSGTTNLTKPVGTTHTLAPCVSTGPDAWFRIEVPDDGVLTARVTSASYRSVVALRRSCEPGTQVACDDAASVGGQLVSAGVTRGEVLMLGVSGAVNPGATPYGRFTIELDLAPTACGDGFTTGAEVCDDGNVTGGDGCSSTCTLEALAGADACPGHEVDLVGQGFAPRTAVVTVDTSELPSRTGGACGGSGPEAVLRVVSDVDGTLEASATAQHPVVLHARTSCGDPSSELLRTSCWGLAAYTHAVAKGVPLSLYVDGLDGASGRVSVRLTVNP